MSLRSPSGWKIDPRNPTAVTNPALCLDLINRGILIRIVEYKPPYLTPDELAAVPQRPRHFSLELLRPSDSNWTRGPVLSFQEHHRVFFVAVTPERLPKDVRSILEAMLDSIRAGSHGHCRSRAFERSA